MNEQHRLMSFLYVCRVVYVTMDGWYRLLSLRMAMLRLSVVDYIVVPS